MVFERSPKTRIPTVLFRLQESSKLAVCALARLPVVVDETNVQRPVVDRGLPAPHVASHFPAARISTT